MVYATSWPRLASGRLPCPPGKSMDAVTVTWIVAISGISANLIALAGFGFAILRSVHTRIDTIIQGVSRSGVSAPDHTLTEFEGLVSIATGVSTVSRKADEAKEVAYAVRADLVKWRLDHNEISATLKTMDARLLGLEASVAELLAHGSRTAQETAATLERLPCLDGDCPKPEPDVTPLRRPRKPA